MTKRTVLFFLVLLSITLTIVGCSSGFFAGNDEFASSGRVTHLNDQGLENVSLHFSGEHGVAKTDENGNWRKQRLKDIVTITPNKEGYTFEPSEFIVSKNQKSAHFRAIPNEFKVISTIPYDGQNNVNVKDPVIEVIFNNKIVNWPSNLYIDVKPERNILGHSHKDEHIIEFNLTSDYILPFDSTITITIDTSTMFDVDGRRLKEPITFSFTTEADTYPPDKPVIGIAFGNETADLVWTDAYDNPKPRAPWHAPLANIYRIYRKVNEDNFRIIATVSSSNNSYIDKNLQPGVYTYYVTAVDKAGNESLPSNKVIGTIE